MTYRVRFTPSATEDLQRLFDFLADQDLEAAACAREAIGRAIEILQTFPLSFRKAAPDNPFLRELVVGFGSAGYVALFEVEDAHTVTVLAVRHQREDDYY